MAQQANQPLPNGFQLEEYTIDRQLSLGGFSIVYLATDADDQQVAIKEYLPNSLALRNDGDVKPVISADHLGAFRYGMKCFFEEGRSLAKLSHPNVIRVLNFFRANDTVYMVMEYEHGRTLQEFIHKHQGHISERFIRGVFTRMLNGLREVHAHKLLHLDLKPSNIYLRASPEHYGSRKDLGPWSDIYSVGASMYACLAGCAPQAADERMKKDTLGPAMLRWEGQYSDRLLEIIDWCLNLNHLYRPQSVFTLQKALVETITPPSPKDAEHWLDRLVGKFRKPTK
jgi:serine/threonine protein kinase